ncbi:beta-1,3-galactosyl-O-glycosyl-glycoprotein beta-1,6-N-acetylglucosaminyltransferase 3 [Cynoglossus semilaevis]|uniref:beta-1,3-galactosyl-O-glycosyl-glycoprotein beta-1,6-N-acetylglucosaminyltransferase 3 n=1 Tax=Cynoglossus semilaevis TaxID=244447 RepID=UPI0004983224|nr:beta-1,3-galactosyl-O-glycosyl-glycoprotein beta-1,6-N-acetylglucosaminyltransferase 3-like [Cynoglossus semilaevis]
MAFVRLCDRRTSKFLKILSIILMTTFLSVVLYETGSRRQSIPDLVIPEQFSLDLPGCLAIITGDVGVKKKEVETLLMSRTKKTFLSPEGYLNLTQDCPSFTTVRGFITTPQSKEEKDFPIAYSIVIHEKIEMFERLLRSIYAPQNVYCVHVDQKSPEEFHKAVAGIAACFPNVFIASKLENVVYASWTRVQADLNCMEDLLKSSVKWKYLLNTCGTDFPIKTNGEIVQALKTLNGRNSMETENTIDYKKPRWQYHHEVTDSIVRTDVTKSPPPIRSPMFSGNAYIIVSREFVTHVMRDKEAQKFIEWEKDTYSPDEHMWATFQRMPSVPGSVPANIKYDVSDMQALARVVKWSYLAGDVNNGAPYPHCTGAYRRAVCVYGAGDILWLFRQQHLFANKFDPEVDDTAIRCIETVLRFKSLGHDPLAPFVSSLL